MGNKIFHQLKKGDGKRQIICFPYLGGYANSFYELSSKLSEDIELWTVNPPGHGGCTLEPLEDINSMLDLYYEELQTIIKSDSVFFGHSMGGIVAYFLAQRIFSSEEYTVKPGTLVLSACNSPCCFQDNTYSCLPDDKLIEHLILYNGILEQLTNEKSLLEFFLPVYRADFKVLETSSTLDYKPIGIPVYFMWGERDKIVPIDSVTQWLRYFKNEINIIPIDEGKHMFINDKATVVADHLENIISKVYV
ncbi:MAG: thioesterase II family protein [Ruminiclostridium sp.]